MTALRNFHSKDATLAGPRRKLSQHHVDYLCSHQTLTAWAHLSLQQRAVLFHRQFPELRVSASLLKRTYRLHGVKFKRIRSGKKIIDYADPYYRELFTNMHRKVQTARQRDLKLFWVDEAVFTFNTFQQRAWSGRNQSISINDADYYVKARALLCAVSDDGGLEAYRIHDRAVVSSAFVEFVHVLADRAGGQEFAIFMDNLKVHKTQEVLDACRQVQATPIFNVPYSPQFNGIEPYFSLVKGEYKK